MKKRKEKIGGMALFNGLMLRSKKREAVGRVTSDGYIEIEMVENVNIKKDDDKFTIYDIPIFRGMLSMKNMIASSVPYVLNSAQNVLKGKDSKNDVEVDKFELIIAYVVSIGIILVLLAAIPNFISVFLNHSIRNVAQAIMQITAFIIYLLLLSKVDSLQTLFKYHGAEHKVANAYEKMKKDEISIESVKKCSRFHTRCGGNFVVYLFFLILFITLLIPSNNLVFKTILQVLVLPFLAGFSYELVMYTEYLPSFLKFLAYPAMSIQLITTKEPDDNQIELAIYTLFGCIDGNKEITIKKFCNEYIKKNTKLKKKFSIKDSLIIISTIKNIKSDELFLKIDEIMLNYNEQIKVKMMLDKLYIKNYPIEYITGISNFYNEKYKVTEDVLIPRKDSEVLVENAISFIENEHLKSMIDMCTGSGCLGISISKNSHIEKTLLVDISKKALVIANDNIIRNNANDKCNILNSDLFSKLKNSSLKFDILVSNPPYIPTKDIDHLDISVKKEPIIALNGGEDGMDYYKKILKEATSFLNYKAIIVFEIGFDELEKIKIIINEAKNYNFIKSIKDYGGNDRVVICRFQKK